LTTDSFKKEALDYHSIAPAGKLSINITKPTNTFHDLSLAYTPGVAEPVREIHKNPDCADIYTAKGNLVAVITNGTAVLGLGNVGALAAKPVMEGKAVLFKRFADVDVFDIEVNCSDPQEFVRTVVNISPTFGGINLEDIKAPECFGIEQQLKDKLNIPVFHDDQHGTAIIVAAGLLNALEIQEKEIDKVKIVCVGAGSAGIASMNLLVSIGFKKENIILVDSKGVIHKGRTDLNQYKEALAVDTDKLTLSEAIVGSDIFIGVAKAGLLTTDMLASMAKKPIVFALSNPEPEIRPEVAYSVRDDVVIATGRSDFPNQINNVLCFPYIFRGALNVKATCINREMRIACIDAIRKLAHLPVPQSVLDAYPNVDKLTFGPKYMIPKPLDPRLAEVVPLAVEKAAIATGVATIKNK